MKNKLNPPVCRRVFFFREGDVTSVGATIERLLRRTLVRLIVR